LQSAGYFKELKIITSGASGCLDRVFDLRQDPTESENLVGHSHHCDVNFDNFGFKKIEGIISKDRIGKSVCPTKISIEACRSRYYGLLISKVLHLMSQLAPFAKFGNTGHQKYMRDIDSSSTCINNVQVYKRDANDSNHSVDGKHVCVCGIPGVSQVKVMDYVKGVDEGQQCLGFKWGCTQPCY